MLTDIVSSEESSFFRDAHGGRKFFHIVMETMLNRISQRPAPKKYFLGWKCLRFMGMGTHACLVRVGP